MNQKEEKQKQIQMFLLEGVATKIESNDYIIEGDKLTVNDKPELKWCTATIHISLNDDNQNFVGFISHAEYDDEDIDNVRWLGPDFVRGNIYDTETTTNIIDHTVRNMQQADATINGDFNTIIKESLEPLVKLMRKNFMSLNDEDE